MDYKRNKRYKPRIQLLQFIFISLICTSTISFKIQNKTHRLNISIIHAVGSSKLVLDSMEYKNELGQTFRISKAKYYLSNFCLKSKNGKEYKLEKSYLINEEDPASKQLSLPVPANENFTTLEFIIGVDSLHNCSGAQSGALDPVNAMFWTWNSGYIFLKLEGTSPTSTSPGHIFEYHIGGYKQPNNCIRNVNLAIDLNTRLSSNQLILSADLLELFKEPTVIDFSKLSSVTDMKNATRIADNYKDMFSIVPNP